MCGVRYCGRMSMNEDDLRESMRLGLKEGSVGGKTTNKADQECTSIGGKRENVPRGNAKTKPLPSPFP